VGKIDKMALEWRRAVLNSLEVQFVRRRWLLPLLAALALAMVTVAQSAAPPVALSAQQIAGETDVALRQLQTSLAAVPAGQGHGKKSDRNEFEQDNVSIQRNLQQAVPGLLSDVRSAPENLSNVFRLYRDVEAVYQVALRALEAASHFSSRQEVDNLSAAVENLRNQENQMADYIQRGAAAQLAELQRLRNDSTRAAQVPATSPKTVVIDNAAVPEKPKPRRGTRKKPPAEKPADQQQQNNTPPQ
jgi:hypothetical protein